MLALCLYSLAQPIAATALFFVAGDVDGWGLLPRIVPAHRVAFTTTAPICRRL